MKEKQNIKEYSLSDIQVFCKANNFQIFRAKQIYEWLWKHSVATFDDMKNVPDKIRNILESNFYINRLSVKYVQKSKDGTIKTGFTLNDGQIVEGVMIPAGKRATACISSQVGCNLACKFCATGKLGFNRNLSAGEIYDQVIEIRKQAIETNNSGLTNIVLMGMGEPLLNYENVLKAIDLIISVNGLGVSPRRITLSTAGVVKGIRRLADDKVKFNLAVSLHAANNEKRNQIMPVNQYNTLEKLSEALVYYHDKTANRITFEYLLMQNFNDGPEDAKELAEYCKAFPVKINLIEYNSIGDGLYKKSLPSKTTAFQHFLESKNIIVNVRRNKGEDIDAACGQLANKIMGTSISNKKK